MQNTKIKWRTIPYTNGYYQVSEFGRVRMVNENARIYNIQTFSSAKYEELTPINKKCLYANHEVLIPYIKYKTSYGTRTAPICSLMYSSFHGIHNLDHYNILHIDGNELNNSIDNIILSDKISKNAYYKNIEDRGSAAINRQENFFGISEYNMNGYRQGLYSNINHAKKNTGIELNFIKNALDGIKCLKYNNLVFKRGIGPAIIDIHLIIEESIIVSNSPAVSNQRQIFQYNAKGHLYRVYNNKFEAAKFNNLSIFTLMDEIKRKKEYEGYIWIMDK